jgi:hypothetical protein
LTHELAPPFIPGKELTMKVTYTTANRRLTFELESDNEKTLVAELGHIQEVFEETKCGCCESELIRFEVRTFEKNKYYKLFCTQCGATLDYHQHKEGGTLYLKDADRSLPSRGWYRFKEQPPPAQAPTAGAPKPATSTNQPAKPTAAASSNGKLTAPAAKKPQTIDEKHQYVLDGYRDARTLQYVEDLEVWAGHQGFSQSQFDAQQVAYRAAKERLATMTRAK